MKNGEKSRERAFPYADVVVSAGDPSQVVGRWWEQEILGVETREEREQFDVHRIYFASDDLLKDFVKWIELHPLLGTIAGGGSVEYADWESFLHGGFEPFVVGDLYVVPAENTPPIPEGLRPLKIIPGRGFGTGSHPTTRLTMHFLADYWNEGPMLDLGTGSGILSVQAALQGSKSIVAVDIDADSIENARENAEVNKLVSEIDLRTGSLETIKEHEFTLITANIIAPVLRNLIEDGLLARLSSGGIILFSGILAVELHSFLTLLKQEQLVIVDQAEINEWCAVVAQKQ